MGYVISSEYRVVFEWVEEKYSERPTLKNQG